MAGQARAPWGAGGVTIPFLHAEYYGVFIAYNTVSWPVQAYLLGCNYTPNYMHRQ